MDEIEGHAQEVAGCFRARVVVEGPLTALRSQVTDALPGAIIVDVWPEVAERGGQEPCHGAPDGRSRQMLKQWLIENQVASVDPQRTARTVRTMVEAATSGRRVGLEEESLLDRDIAEGLIRELTQTMNWVDSEAEALTSRCSPLYLSLLGTRSRSHEDRADRDLGAPLPSGRSTPRRRSWRQVSGAMVGPTGAGNWMLLEAICFALLRGATCGGKAYKEARATIFRRSASV